MSVNRDAMAEYEKRHNPIWESMQKVLKSHGASNYSIFLDRDTCELFGYVEIESEERWKQIAQTRECRKWWEYMCTIMPSNPDKSPVEKVLKEVFHLD